VLTHSQAARSSSLRRASSSGVAGFLAIVFTVHARASQDLVS
jgi:hypothetical protein